MIEKSKVQSVFFIIIIIIYTLYEVSNVFTLTLSFADPSVTKLILRFQLENLIINKNIC